MSTQHPAHDYPTDYCKDTFCGGYTTIVETKDVTDEVLDLAESYAEGFYVNRGERVDWNDLMDRLDGLELDDRTRIDLGNEYDTPAWRKIQRETRKRLRGE